MAHHGTNQHVPLCPNTDSNKNVSVFCEMSLSTAAASDVLALAVFNI